MESSRAGLLPPKSNVQALLVYQTERTLMIGLIRLTAQDKTPVWVNPTFIGFFLEPTEQICKEMGMNSFKGTVVSVAGIKMTVRDTPNEIVNALTRLRQKNEENTLNLIKKKDKEDWQGDDED